MTTPVLAVGVNAVILDEQRRVLLTHRVDNGRWWVPCGHLEVGEQPAAAVVREVREETGLQVRPLGLSSVLTEEPDTYADGTPVQFVDFCFVCAPQAGQVHVADDENDRVEWFALDALPELHPELRRKLDLALTFSGRTWFA